MTDKPRQRTGLVLAALVTAGLGLFAAASPALAHGGDPVITVEATHPAGTSVHFIVRMVWEDDGDPINGKVVTATPTGPDGLVGTAVTLIPGEDGRYEGAVDTPQPGTWTVTIASANPVGSIDHSLVVPDTATTTTVAPTTTTTATAQDSSDDDEPTSQAVVEEDDGYKMPVLVVLIVAALLAMGAVAMTIVIVRSRRSQPSP